jgi:hypothetical protein
MGRVFNTSLVDGMTRDGHESGCGDRFADWNEEPVRSICMKVLDDIHRSCPPCIRVQAAARGLRGLRTSIHRPRSPATRP